MMQARVHFHDAKLLAEFSALAKGDGAKRRLHRAVMIAISQIQEDAFAGTQVQKRLIPLQYRQEGIQNLWKMDLPGGWRLLYTITSEKVIIVAIVLEWLDHGQYERRFRY